MVQRLTKTFEAAGVEVELSESEAAERDSEGGEDRYTAVAE
jgi:hypothetical protein